MRDQTSVLKMNSDFVREGMALAQVLDYVDENVSTKVVKTIHSYTGIVN